MSANARTAIDIVEQQVKRWGTSYAELRQCYVDLLGDTGEYLCHPDMPIVNGSTPALEMITGFHEGFGVETIEVDWVKLTQVGNDVWNERIDHMVDKDGKRFLEIPIAGYFSFDDEGTLTHWHDYWDMRPLLALAPAPAA